MQTLEFDQFEFANPSTEEHLRLAVERKSRMPVISTFLDQCLSRVQQASLVSPIPPQPFQECFWRREVEDLLARFAPQLVPDLDESMVTVLLNEFDEHWLLIDSPRKFILYEWRTSA